MEAPELLAPINQVPVWSSPSIKSNKSKLAGASPWQNSGKVGTGVPDSGASTTEIVICSVSKQVPLSIVYVNKNGLPAVVNPEISIEFDTTVSVASLQTPVLLSCEPSKASNKLNGELELRSFSHKVWFTASPALGSANMLTCTVLELLGHEVNKFCV